MVVAVAFYRNINEVLIWAVRWFHFLVVLFVIQDCYLMQTLNFK